MLSILVHDYQYWVYARTMPQRRVQLSKSENSFTVELDHPVSSSSAVPSLLHLNQHACANSGGFVTYGMYLAPASSMFCLTSSGNCREKKLSALIVILSEHQYLCCLSLPLRFTCQTNPRLSTLFNDITHRSNDLDGIHPTHTAF